MQISKIIYVNVRVLNIDSFKSHFLHTFIKCHTISVAVAFSFDYIAYLIKEQSTSGCEF